MIMRKMTKKDGSWIVATVWVTVFGRPLMASMREYMVAQMNRKYSPAMV